MGPPSWMRAEIYCANDQIDCVFGRSADDCVDQVDHRGIKNFERITARRPEERVGKFSHGGRPVFRPSREAPPRRACNVELVEGQLKDCALRLAAEAVECQQQGTAGVAQLMVVSMQPNLGGVSEQIANKIPIPVW